MRMSGTKKSKKIATNILLLVTRPHLSLRGSILYVVFAPIVCDQKVVRVSLSS